MNIQELFIKLLKAQSEEEVIQIIYESPILSDEKNWKPYGGTFGNYSSFENQQTTAEAALIEKITNAIDAILIRQCYLKGIEPSAPSAPQSMKSATDILFTKKELEEESIIVLTDGNKSEPNVIIMDEGEGQRPEDFENTFLSLQTGNKNNIKFVQGKFNMGSTGAVVFCGKNKFQLIASRRHSSISNEEKEMIGFTLVRKHVRTPEEELTMKNTWYEYFTINGEIPNFYTDSVKLNEELEDPRYTFKQGSIVKLYNYNLEKKSQSFQQLKQDINSLLYFPAFPVYVMETRDYGRTNTANIAYGNGNLLRGNIKCSTIQNRLEHYSLNNQLQDRYFGDINIDIFVFKENEKNIAREVRGTKPIVFLMNGQVQYHLGTSFISNDLGFKQIKNHLVVTIDCTNLSTAFLDEGLFMANRESIRHTPETKRFIELITDFLKNNEALINCNKMRASQKVTSKGTQEIFEKLLGKDKNSFLKKLFQPKSMGTNSKYNDHIRKKLEEKENVDLYEFPSFFKLDNVKKDDEGNFYKSIPLNKGSKFKLKTDASNDYFTRSDQPGKIKIEVLRESIYGEEGSEIDYPEDGDGKSNGGISTATVKNKTVVAEKIFTIGRTGLQDGEMSISLLPNETMVRVNEKYKVKITISDNKHEFTNLLVIRIEAPVKKAKNPRKKRKQQEGLNLPSLIQVYRNEETIRELNRSKEEIETYETWLQRNWSEEEGKEKVVEIKPGPDDLNPINEIAINMSSPVLQQIINEEGTTGTQIELAQEQFLMNLYMQSFLLTTGINHMVKSEKDIKIDEVEEFCAKLVKQVAYGSVKMQLNSIRSLEK